MEKRKWGGSQNGTLEKGQLNTQKPLMEELMNKGYKTWRKQIAKVKTNSRSKSS